MRYRDARDTSAYQRQMELRNQELVTLRAENERLQKEIVGHRECFYAGQRLAVLVLAKLNSEHTVDDCYNIRSLAYAFECQARKYFGTCAVLEEVEC